MPALGADAAEPRAPPACRGRLRATVLPARRVSVLSGLLRVAYGRYVPAPARNAARLNPLLVQRDREPVRTAQPAGRVVVLAPHRDGELFGCGGKLAKVAAGGG